MTGGGWARVVGAVLLAAAIPGPGPGSGWVGGALDWPGASPARAQESGGDLLRSLRAGPDQEVRVRFETDDGVLVCDDGSVSTGGRSVYWGRHRDDRSCQEFEAQVRLRVRDGEVRDVSRPEPVEAGFGGADVGPLSGPEAGTFFMALAREGDGEVAERALFPALLARGATVWPGLLELARDRERPSDLREKAVFWLGQEAAATVNDDLRELAVDDSEDDEVRDAAVFALSQRPRDEGVPALMELARSSAHPRVRKKAMFWLAQSQDPRVLPFFEEILLASGGG